MATRPSTRAGSAKGGASVERPSADEFLRRDERPVGVPGVASGARDGATGVAQYIRAASEGVAAFNRWSRLVLGAPVDELARNATHRHLGLFDWFALGMSLTRLMESSRLKLGERLDDGIHFFYPDSKQLVRASELPDNLSEIEIRSADGQAEPAYQDFRAVRQDGFYQIGQDYFVRLLTERDESGVLFRRLVIFDMDGRRILSPTDLTPYFLSTLATDLFAEGVMLSKTPFNRADGVYANLIRSPMVAPWPALLLLGGAYFAGNGLRVEPDEIIIRDIGRKTAIAPSLTLSSKRPNFEVRVTGEEGLVEKGYGRVVRLAELGEYREQIAVGGKKRIRLDEAGELNLNLSYWGGSTYEIALFVARRLEINVNYSPGAQAAKSGLDAQFAGPIELEFEMEPGDIFQVEVGGATYELYVGDGGLVEVRNVHVGSGE